MYRRYNYQFGGLFGLGADVSPAANAVNGATVEATVAIKDGETAISQGREVIAMASRNTDDMDAYVKRIQNIPIDELARRFDYKTKVAVDELMSLSSFMKKSLIYLAGMATLSVYLNLLTKK